MNAPLEAVERYDAARKLLADTPHTDECIANTSDWDKALFDSHQLLEMGECDCDREVRAMLAFAALEASSRQEERLMEALDRQCDTVAFILNRVDLPPQWADKFERELAEDRAALEPPHAKDAADV